MRNPRERLRRTAVAATLSLGLVTAAQAAVTDQLVAHLTFDDTYNDASGRNNHGTPMGAPEFVPGKVGSKAVKVSNNGVRATDGGRFNYVTLGHPADLEFGTDVDFSVTAWVKFTDWKGDPAIISNMDWNSGGNVGWVVATAGSGGLQHNFHEQGVGRIEYEGPDHTLDNGQWHHVAVTFQRGGRARTYLDGKRVDDRDCLTAGTTIEPSLPVNIGQDGNRTYTGTAAGVRWGDCAIDDVALWRRVITGDEVLNVYNRGAYYGLNVEQTSLSDDLVAYLPFEGNNNDSSGRGLNGTAVGAPTFKSGKVGQSLAFTSARDGSSFNYVSLGRPSELNFGKDANFSFAFWGRLGQWEGNPAFLGNKDWNNSRSQGWITAASGDGHFQWNLGDQPPGGSGGNRVDYNGPPALFNDGAWHHFVVALDRAGKAVTYVDGVRVSLNAVYTVTGTLDTPEGQATNIGQDGKGTYTGNNGMDVTDGQVDEVSIWRRLLLPADVAELFTYGNSGKNLFGETVPTVVPAVIKLTPRADGSFDLEYTGTLQAAGTLNGMFLPAPDASSPYHVQPATGPAAQYYRSSN